MSLTGMRKRFEAHMKVVMWMFAFIFLISVFFFYGAYMSAPRTQAGAGAPSVLAVAGGEKITRDDLQARLSQMEQQGGAPSLDMTEWTRYRTLQEVILERLVLQDARNRGLRVSGDEVDRQIAGIIEETLKKETRGRTPSPQREAELEAFWKGRRDSLERQLLIQKLAQQIVGKVSAKPKEVEEAFEEIKAGHILVSLSPLGKKKRTDEEALRRAQQLHDRVLKGEDFAAVAKKESDDVGTAQKGGDLGWFARGVMTPEFERAAFSLKAGQVSGPVKTPFGYHIIKVEGRRLPSDFEKNRKKYEQQFLDGKQQRLWASHLGALQKAGAPKILDPEFLGVAAMIDMRGREKEAAEYFNTALRYAPSLGTSVHAAILWCLAGQYATQKQWENAARTYEEAAGVAADSLERIYLSLAEMYVNMHKTPQAIEQVRAAVDEAPGDVNVSNRAEQLYRQLGRKDLAEAEKKRREAQLKKQPSAAESQPSATVGTK